MVDIITLPYEGGEVKVELKPCRHCRAVPTANDAVKAIAHDRKTVKSCAVCGGKPKMYPQYGIYHSVDLDVGSVGWVLCGSDTYRDPGWDPQWVGLMGSGPSGYAEAAFHLECLKKAAPGVKILPR